MCRCASDKAHKILHTSEKMDTINPTIELTRSEGLLKRVNFGLDAHLIVQGGLDKRTMLASPSGSIN
jgi:hypothetical protein